MKRAIFVLITLTIFVFSCQNSKTSSNKQQTKQAPTAYRNNEYNFEVMFPGKPQSQVSTIKTDLGNVKQVTYSVEQGRITYVVQVSIYPDKFKNQVNPTEVVKTQVLTLAQNMDLTEQQLLVNNITGKPSIYYEGQAPNGYAIMQAIAWQNKVYIVAALADGQDAKQILQDKGVNFIKSFKLF